MRASSPKTSTSSSANKENKPALSKVPAVTKKKQFQNLASGESISTRSSKRKRNVRNMSRKPTTPTKVVEVVDIEDDGAISSSSDEEREEADDDGKDYIEVLDSEDEDEVVEVEGGGKAVRKVEEVDTDSDEEQQEMDVEDYKVSLNNSKGHIDAAHTASVTDLTDGPAEERNEGSGRLSYCSTIRNTQLQQLNTSENVSKNHLCFK